MTGAPGVAGDTHVVDRFSDAFRAIQTAWFGPSPVGRLNVCVDVGRVRFLDVLNGVSVRNQTFGFECHEGIQGYDG